MNHGLSTPFPFIFLALVSDSFFCMFSSFLHYPDMFSLPFVFIRLYLVSENRFKTEQIYCTTQPWTLLWTLSFSSRLVYLLQFQWFLVSSLNQVSYRYNLFPAVFYLSLWIMFLVVSFGFKYLMFLTMPSQTIEIWLRITYTYLLWKHENHVNRFVWKNHFQ